MFLFFFGLRSASSCGGYIGIVLQSWRWSRGGLTVVTIGVVLQIWRWSHGGAALASSCRSGGGLAVVQLRGGAWASQ